MDTFTWYTYETLNKPSWAPPAELFTPVWYVLYAIILVTFGAVFRSAAKEELPMTVVWPFVLNLVFNFAFMPLQFVFNLYGWAAFDIVLTIATLVWGMWAVYKYMAWVALANIPYLVWLCIATILQLSIIYMN